MTLAVVIIAAGREPHLRRTLEALHEQEQPPDEVVVVDIDPRRSVAAALAPSDVLVRLTGPPEPLPLAAARNAGVDACTATNVVLLDVDCLPAPDLVAAYDGVLREHPEAIACGPVRYLREGWSTTFDRSQLEMRGRVLRALSEAHPVRPTPSFEGVRLADDHHLFWSLAFGVTQATWNAVGRFDPGYVGYGAEDTDFAFRARHLGVPLAWFGTGIAYHQWHPPTRLDENRTAEIVANARRFRNRWGHWPMSDWLSELQLLGRVVFDPDADVLEVSR